MKPTMHIDNYNAAQIREQGIRGVTSGPVEYGGAPERIAGTGRATCRNCGKKIAKDIPAMRFYWDFHGCGSWTATLVQLHENPSDCSG
jgi:hypothetical protein